MKFIIIINFFLISLFVISKEINFTTPILENYASQETGGTRATWGITQNKNGKMFFINTYGVLVFDGSDWRSMRLKGNSTPRAIHADKEGNILIGFNGVFILKWSQKIKDLDYSHLSLIGKKLENIN